MAARFFVPGLDPNATTAMLPGDEARHLTRVMRLGAGDEIAVFDGAGHEYRARVSHAVKDRVEVELIEAVAPAAEPRVRLTLVQAVLKSDHMDDVVRDATMMGVSAIVPVVTAHTVVPTEAIRRGRPVERWRRVVVSSAKQCRRATLPSIAEPIEFERWLAERYDGSRLLLVEPSASTGSRSLRTLPRPHAAAVVVGPEGGWSASERDAAAAAGCLPVTLGQLTLRADAVAVAGLAVLRFLWESE
jgi:16S rRNA (uracil1498-N3)-methyltransferase